MAPAGSERLLSPVFLLDTNICIYVLGDAGSLPAQRLGDCAPGDAAISAVTCAELMRGVDPDDARQVNAAHRFFEILAVLPFDLEAARTYARLPFRRGSFDRLIAAHALSRGLILVTNDERDFSGIAGLEIENWARP